MNQLKREQTQGQSQSQPAKPTGRPSAEPHAAPHVASRVAPHAVQHGSVQHGGHVVKMTGKESKDFRGVIRLLGRDIEGHTTIKNALRKIKGFGHNAAANLTRIFEKRLGVKPDTMIGELNDQQLQAIEEIAREPFKHGFREHLLNRPRDPETDLSKHLAVNDLIFTLRQDLERERNTRSWKGWRLSIGQRVRGQHTRTTGRTGLTVGVLKKAIKAQKAAAAAGAQEAGKKEEKK